MSKLSHRGTFNTETIIDERISAETKILNDMELVHKYLPENKDGNVDLAKLTLENFGVCKELFSAASRLARAKIHVIPSEQKDRVITAALAIVMD